jgi:hypothetical protein
MYEVCYQHYITQFHMTDKHDIDWVIALGQYESSNWTLASTSRSGLYPENTLVGGGWYCSHGRVLHQQLGIAAAWYGCTAGGQLLLQFGAALGRGRPQLALLRTFACKGTM